MIDDLAKATIDRLDKGGRILVTRLQYLGDVVLSLSLIDALQERFPKAQIDYLSRSDGAAILQGETRIAMVHRVPDGADGRTAMLRLIRDLRARRYDLAIDLFSNPRSALLSWLSGARMRIGGDRRGRRLFYTHPISVPATVRSARDHHLYHLNLLGVEAVAGAPRLTVGDTERKDARAQLSQARVDPSRPTIAIHPGGKWEVKRWPAASYAELARRLYQRGQQVVVLCGPGEEQFRDEVRQLCGGKLSYLPTMPLRTTAAVISQVDGIVLNDGGIMHVAVATGTPTVGIFGSAEPDIWFPYEGEGPFVPALVDIDCRPCHSHVCSHISCLRHLTVDHVLDRLDDVLGDDGARSLPQS